MRKFLLLSHGGFAKGIQHSLGLFLGEQHAFDAISAYMDDTPVQDQIQAYMDQLQEEDELIILSDIAGGSVNQLMMPYLKREHTFIIAGFNFPLLLELSVLPPEPLTQQVLFDLVERTKESMQVMDLMQVLGNSNEDDE